MTFLKSHCRPCLTSGPQPFSIEILFPPTKLPGKKDPTFSSRLKIAWDTEFKKNPNLILVICGSVSSWIEANISKNASFEGCISLEMHLTELTLQEIELILMSRNIKLSAKEQLLILSITGGVPKYLEELHPKQSASQNIMRLCFEKGGFLPNEYERIFWDIFERRAKSFERIIKLCLEKKHSPTSLAKLLGTSVNSDLSE